MTEPAQFDNTKTPFVLLCGKQWPIPKLGPRQMKNIYAEVFAVTAALERPGAQREEASLGETIVRLSNDEISKVFEVVFWALTKAHPQLTRDEFFDMDIEPFEAVTAFFVIRVQTGMFRPAPVNEVQEAA